MSSIIELEVVTGLTSRKPYAIYLKGIGVEVVARLLDDSSNGVFRVEWILFRQAASVTDAELRAALAKIDDEARERNCSFCFIDEPNPALLKVAEQLGFSRRDVKVGTVLVKGVAKVLKMEPGSPP